MSWTHADAWTAPSELLATCSVMPTGSDATRSMNAPAPGPPARPARRVSLWALTGPACGMRHHTTECVTGITAPDLIARSNNINNKCMQSWSTPFAAAPLAGPQPPFTDYSGRLPRCRLREIQEHSNGPDECFGSHNPCSISAPGSARLAPQFWPVCAPSYLLLGCARPRPPDCTTTASTNLRQQK